MSKLVYLLVLLDELRRKMGTGLMLGVFQNLLVNQACVVSCVLLRDKLG